MKPQDDLAVCRSVTYMRGPAGRKGVKKCSQCGFWFVPDSQLYPLYEQEPDHTHITGVEWYEQFKCCPNCLPKDGRAAYGRRRCLGQKNHGGWTRHKGCLTWASVSSQSRATQERNNGSRIQFCSNCKAPQITASWTTHPIVTVRALIKKIGRVPTIREWDRYVDRPCAKTIQGHFGSWNAFIELAGAVPRKSGVVVRHVRRYSDSTILSALRTAYDRHGRALSAREWQERHLIPSVGAVHNHFGWRNAWIKIGVPPVPCCQYDAEMAQASGKRIGALSKAKRVEREALFNEAFHRKLREMEQAEEQWEAHKFKKRSEAEAA